MFLKRFFSENGFTMIEMLVVLSIIVILAALITPATHLAKEKARKTQCINNLKQISVALNMFANEHGGDFPPDGAVPNTWMSHLFPNYIRAEENFDCPSHPYVGTLATGPDYWYQSGYTLDDNPQALIVGCYEGCHAGMENKLTIGGNVIFQKSATAFP
ncbi:MAG: type II secretion system protein [Candidatus Aureabacteria bacterium]|nr:type II secretion system protein [Candidatus Auribacterota bacterium]